MKRVEVKDHPAGYRSVHYVIESLPLNRKIIAEIQVRTIFEEGWSEIDHKIRYPNFSDNELVRYFLEIFNRMAGSADDMGGFVLGLVATLSHLEEEINVIGKEKEAIFKDMEQALNQLENVKKQDKASKENIAKLKEELSKLKLANTLDNILSGSTAEELLVTSASKQASYGLPGFRLSELMNNDALSGSRLTEMIKKFGLSGSSLSARLAADTAGLVNPNKKSPPK